MRKVLCVLSLIALSLFYACSNPTLSTDGDTDEEPYDYISYDYISG